MSKRKPEPKATQMDQTSNLQEMPPESPDDAVIDAALEPAPVPSFKEQAAAEEILQAQRIEQARALQEATQAKADEPEQEEFLATLAPLGREHLLQRLREHAERTAAKKEAYTPPPMTASQLARLREEQEAGQRSIARHEAQQANRPAPKKEIWDGDNTVVARPDNVVPDPMKTPTSGFVAGDRGYSPDA